MIKHLKVLGYNGLIYNISHILRLGKWLLGNWDLSVLFKYSIGCRKVV